ncbi:hypothetical protein [Vulgatibacter incomptus]|uniref:Uncharacterized protein n=1 Tax=Vulgatibacter incomptus TaxID=1391653 RepID=A0A0K1PE79_9BACT|nr:hypothetical protein [Vulgatibacter incomptus]AKU91706.1 hypothetical protein AKJ08_2093 [Vulgatibacter incomptus]
MAGLAGTLVMTAVQDRVLPHIPSGTTRRTPRFPRDRRAADEVATETAARRLFEGVTRRRLPDERRKLAGDLMHYATGAAWGGLYALVARGGRGSSEGSPSARSSGSWATTSLAERSA